MQSKHDFWSGLLLSMAQHLFILCSVCAKIRLRHSCQKNKATYSRDVSRTGVSGRVWAGFGPKLDKISSLFRARNVLFVVGAQNYNQNNLATLLNFSDLT